MAAVTLAAVCAPVFVLGVYSSGLLAPDRLTARPLLIVSWILVVAGIALSSILPVYAVEFDSEWWLRVAPVVLGALPAGMGFARLSRRSWMSFVPVVTGIAAEAVVYALVYVRPPFIFKY
jgi:hypothetical protein